MSEGLRLLVDLVIAVTVIEFAWLAYWHRRHGRGVNPADIVRNLLSGLMLMLALRAALVQGSPWLVMVFLVAAGFFHGLDILKRWQR